MRAVLSYFSPTESVTPGFVGQLCRIDTDAGLVEATVLIREKDLDAYVTARAVALLQQFGDRATLRDLGALPDDGALRAFLGLPGRRQ